MRFGSIGIPAVSRSSRRDRPDRRAGFTLLEALVALTLILALAAVLGPFLSQARRIVDKADGRIAAQALLRSLLETTLDRSNLWAASREGEADGLRWSVVVEPARLDALAGREQALWIPFRVAASVSWAPGRSVAAETVRLGIAR